MKVLASDAFSLPWHAGAIEESWRDIGGRSAEGGASGRTGRSCESRFPADRDFAIKGSQSDYPGHIFVTNSTRGSMVTRDTTFLLVQRLRRLVEKHGYTANSLATALNRRGLRNNFGTSRFRAFKLDDTVAILNFLGEPLEALLAPQRSVREPVRLLRKHRLALAPQSPDLRRWLRQPYVLNAVQPGFRMPVQVAELKIIGQKVPDQALHYAQRWVDDVLASLYVRETDAGVLTLITALTSWASVVRRLGRSSDAAFAIEHAAGLWGNTLPPVGTPWVRLLYQSGFILKELAGQDGVMDAIPLLQQSLGLAQMEKDQALIVEQYQGLVILARYVQAYDLARSAAESALALCSDPLDSLIIYQHLAFIRCEQEAPNDAQRYLSRIADLDLRPPSWTEPYIAWAQAKIYASSGRLRDAAALFEKILKETNPPNPVDHLLIFCELAKVLHCLGDQDKLRHCAIRVARVVPRLDVSFATLQLLDGFLRQCGEGAISADEIEAAVRSLASSRG